MSDTVRPSAAVDGAKRGSYWGYANVVSRRMGYLRLCGGWIFGVAHFTLGNNWIQRAFTYQDAMPHWLGYFAVVLLSLYLALYPAIAAGLAWRFAPARSIGDDRTAAGPGFVLIFGAAWIATECATSPSAPSPSNAKPTGSQPPTTASTVYGPPKTEWVATTVSPSSATSTTSTSRAASCDAAKRAAT